MPCVRVHLIDPSADVIPYDHALAAKPSIRLEDGLRAVYQWYSRNAASARHAGERGTVG